MLLLALCTIAPRWFCLRYTGVGRIAALDLSILSGMDLLTVLNGCPGCPAACSCCAGEIRAARSRARSRPVWTAAGRMSHTAAASSATDIVSC